MSVNLLKYISAISGVREIDSFENWNNMSKY